MSIRNYIDFKFDNDGYFYAEIHNNGKYRIIRSTRNLDTLMDLAEKYGYIIDGEIRIVRHAREIREEYDKSKNKKRLNIYGNINDDMKISRKNKGIGRKVAAILLTTVILGAGAKATSTIISNSNSNNISMAKYDDSYDQQGTDDIINYLEDSEISETIPTEENDFHFSYEDRTSSENIDNVNRYDDIFEKYAKTYGVDINLIKAMAAQESGGDHYGNIEDGPAAGIMQIEKSANIGYSVTAYNFETGEDDTVYMTEENLKDIDTNIKVGTIILRNCLDRYNYNIPLAVQAYNFGQGNVDYALGIYCDSKNISEDKIIDDSSNNSWLECRDYVDEGDSKYIEHVFSYIPNNSKISVLDYDGNTHSITITNDEKTKTM